MTENAFLKNTLNHRTEGVLPMYIHTHPFRLKRKTLTVWDGANIFPPSALKILDNNLCYIKCLFESTSEGLHGHWFGDPHFYGAPSTDLKQGAEEMKSGNKLKCWNSTMAIHFL